MFKNITVLVDHEKLTFATKLKKNLKKKITKIKRDDPA